MPREGSVQRPVCTEGQNQSDQHDEQLFNTVKERLQKDVQIIEELLPSCFLGMLYLWWKMPKKAVACWQVRIDKLDQYSANYHDIGTQAPASFNHSLWTYLYTGLVCVFGANQSFGDVDLLHDMRLSSSLLQVKNVFGVYADAQVVHQTNEADPRVTSCYRYACNLLKEALDLHDIMCHRGPDIIGPTEKKKLDLLFQPIRELKNQIVSD
jgi:hypothetical protein